jgi:hypothetical protein
MNPSRSENPVGRATARVRLDAARHAWRSRSSDAPAAPKPPCAARVVGPLPLPSGPGRFTVEPDGTLLFADGSCAAFVRIDAFLNLWSLGPHDQARVCREFGVLVHGLAHAQGMQALIESTPTEADAVIAAVGAQITTDDQELRAVADGTLGWLDGEVRRAHVPALSGYILVSPALAVKGGFAGVVEEFRDQVGLRRTGPAAVDRHGLDAAVGDALAQVRAMDLAGTRLRRADVLALLWRCINPGAAQPADLAAACGPDARDGDLAAALMPRHWEERRREIAHTTADGVTTYTRSLYLLAAKDVTSPGYLGDLIALDCAARLSWHLRGLDNLRERTRVLRKRKASAASVRRAYEKHRLPSLDDEDALEEAGALAQGLHSADEGLALSTVVLTLQAPTVDDLDTATRRALSLIGTRLGIHPGKGRGYQKPLWQASLPLGQNMARRRAKRWHTAVIGNSLPFVSHNPGTATGMPLGFTTRGHELVLLDLLDPSLPNAVGIVAGRPGMGKCVTPDTVVWSGGLRRFGDVWGEDTIQGPHTVDRVSAWYDDGERDGYRVETEAGFVIDGTPAHRVWVRDDDGYEGWRRMGALTGREHIALARGVADWGQHEMPLDEAYALGLVIADGTFAAAQGREIVTVDKHPLVIAAIAPVLKRWRQGAGNRSTADVRIVAHNDRHATATITASHLHTWLADTYGLRPAHSHDKEAPAAVLRGTRDVVRAFLRGYFDGDGYCNTQHGQTINVAVGTASPALAAQVQHLLLGLGVYAARRVKPVPGHRDAHIVAIRDAEAFAREVGFTRHGLPKDRALVALLERPRNTNTDTVPGLGPLLRAARRRIQVAKHDTAHPWRGANRYWARAVAPSYPTLRRLIACLPTCPERAELERVAGERRAWTRIARIVPSRQRRIDCTVEGSHAFIGNGMVNHNTITLNRLGLWSLYAGRRVCFIDPAGHFGPLVELAGGELVAPGKQRAPKTVNLWDLPAGADLSEKVEHLVAAHEIMLTKRGEDLSPLHRALLDTAAQRVYADRGLVEGIAADDLRPLVGTDAPLEGELVAYLWRMADEEGRTLGEQEMLRQMHASLQQYVGRGRYARLVDRFTTANIEARALSFDLGELPDHVYDLLMFTVTTAMAGRAKSMYDATRGTSLEVLIADELWGMTERASAGHAIKDTALRSRHRGMAFLGATQQVSVLADNPVAKALLDAASLKCIYRLHDVRGGGDRSTVDYICDVLHAPAETAERLRGLRMGQMMMFRESKDGNVRHGEVDVMLPPLEKWMMTTEPWKDVPRRNEAVARLGSVAAAITELAGGEG